jgi:aminocarboxymuconate-semialdehyde decarboxylase
MAIDIHTHVVPANFPKSVRGEVAGWPVMEAAQKCHRNIVIDGKLYRTLSDRCWDTAGRLADMDQTGVSLQAISPMPELFSYWMDTAAANELLRFINEQTAEFVALREAGW